MDQILLNESPRLAPPGAGLPWLELKIASLGFALLSKRTNREKSAELLAKERAAILKLAVDCNGGKGTERVLIKRLPGMEDSSRFWSVYMTLEHLRLVNHAVAGTIHLLAQGEVPDRKANTADVKPDPGADEKAIRGFETSCDLIERTVSRIGNLAATRRFDHPWFGPLDAGQWYFLAGFHMGLHRKQIVRILQQLES